VVTKTEKLKHPAVREAVCELRFSKGPSYTMIPGAMRERLRTKFPAYEVLPTASLFGALPDEIQAPPVPHHRFRSQFPNALVQTGPRLLTINVLPVYPTFETFRELILDVLHSYIEATECGNPETVALRYINHIPRSSGGDDISAYLNFSIGYPGQLPSPPQESAARVVLPYPAVGSLGIAVSFPAQIENGEIGALLDLSLYQSDPGKFDLENFPNWLDRAHEIVYAAFTSMVLEPIIARMRG